MVMTMPATMTISNDDGDIDGTDDQDDGDGGDRYDYRDQHGGGDYSLGGCGTNVPVVDVNDALDTGDDAAGDFWSCS